jgi:hypothetical protein
MMERYYYDGGQPLKPYTSTVYSEGGFPPGEWTEVEPPAEAEKWPCWNGDGWDLVEDHRGETGWVDGLFTQVTALGPLPDGFTIDAPVVPLTPEEEAAAALEAERAAALKELDELDRKSIRAIRALELDPESETDKARLAEIEARAVELRALLGGQ